MLSCFCRDIEEIYAALMDSESDDLDTMGNALTALVAIAREQQAEIKRLKRVETEYGEAIFELKQQVKALQELSH